MRPRALFVSAAASHALTHDCTLIGQGGMVPNSRIDASADGRIEFLGKPHQRTRSSPPRLDVFGGVADGFAFVAETN